MKAVLISVFVLSASSSFGLVRELASCETSDGRYTVSVQDNQGTGPVRESHLEAAIRSASGQVVGSYEVVVDRGVRSISFGRQGYQDSLTSGTRFKLQGPSTNFRHYSVDAKFNVDGSDVDLRDDDLRCKLFQVEDL